MGHPLRNFWQFLREMQDVVRPYICHNAVRSPSRCSLHRWPRSLGVGVVPRSRRYRDREERGDVGLQSAVQPVTAHGNPSCSLPCLAGCGHGEPVNLTNGTALKS